ncbi:ABC transporter permease [Prevotella sp. 10(H)]|uniref:ABC transporter permease n=1 Tax=Prevotella sp. 10(H) TaxID=1158294 RepID=UPI0004A783A3|nr:ABC transporter permease [Prevotella sp. 10(H)]
MNIFRLYKRTRSFLWVNITGLAIGLATAIMLILFITNELSYDGHLVNKDRIVNLITIYESNGAQQKTGITLRKAYKELPSKVPGIEAAVQIYGIETAEAIYQSEHFQNIKLAYMDPEFFTVFPMKFIEGTPQEALKDMQSIVLTRKKAEMIFGSTANAIGKPMKVGYVDGIVAAVVEEIPMNTHFSIDAAGRIPQFMEEYYGGLEFITYYLIDPNVSKTEVSAAIEKEYTALLEPWAANFSAKAYGVTQNATDIYMYSKAENRFWKRGSMTFIWLLSGLTLFILILAITNFINLFMAQGETRMNEIGIRKTNGAFIKDIVQQFFKEVSTIVLIAFVLGYIIAVICTPYFGDLIRKDIDLAQLLNPVFILCIIGLFLITVVLSAFYPAFYLSKFSPLEILGKRIKFSKRRLNTIVVIFQSLVTICLISFILVISKQTSYLQNIASGYNPEGVMSMPVTENIGKSFLSVKNELLSHPEVKMVSGAHHIIGGGCSGQTIGLLDDKEKKFSIREYRVMPELSELMEFKLKEGEFYRESTPDSVKQVVLNEAAIKMMGFTYPVVGKMVDYRGTAEIIGVVEDFYYDSPANTIEPIILTRVGWLGLLYIKFDESLSRRDAEELTLTTLRKFDPEFYLNPTWSSDIYNAKFDVIKTQAKVISIASFLSILIAMLGLVAMHLYTTMRRTKEIGIRRVNGASSANIFKILSRDIIIWICIAGIIAIPIVYYYATDWLNNYTNHANLDWTIFVLPLVVQCIIAIAVTSGVSWRALSQNPVEALRTD